MAQDNLADPIITPSSVVSLSAAIIANAVEAVRTSHSGTVEPTVTSPYQFWADTTADKMKFRNAADSAWIIAFDLVTGAGTDDVTAIHTDATGEIAALAQKVLPLGADHLVIESDADGDAKRRVLISDLPTGADADAIHASVTAEISALTQKVTPLGADHMMIESAADGNAKRRVLLSDLPSVSLPVLDTTSLVEDTVDPTKEMRIDVGAVLTGTVRVLTMPDLDIDLTPGTGTFVSRVHDHEAAAGGGTLASAALPTAFTSDTASEISGLAEKVSPLSADKILIESDADGNAKRYIQIGNLPAGGEINDLEGDGAAGIAIDELVMGTGAGAVTYKKISILAEELTPATGDWILGETAAGALVKIDPDNMPGGGGGDTLPVVDTKSIVEDPIDATKEMRIDVGAVATLTVRTLTMPDADIDLTPGTGSFATEAEGNLAATALQAEVNDLVTDGVAGIAADEVPVGTGAGTVAYTNTTGTGIVVRQSNPTIDNPGIANFVSANHDHSDASSGGTVLPLTSAVPLIELPGGLAQSLSFDLSAITAFTPRTMTYPDQNIDLTPGTGSFATEAEGTLAASAVQDGGDLSSASVALAALANFKANSIIGNDLAVPGVPQEMDELDVATVAPAGSDFLLGWTAAGLLRKYTVTSMPAGSEANDLETDGTFGIATGELPIGTGANAVTYQKISALTEETTPAAGDFLLGEESGGLVRKFDIGDLPSGTPAADSITNVELANMLADRIKGRANGGGTGDPQDLTAAQVLTIIGVEAGATADQTNAEIRTAVEAATNSNVFDDTDHSKLGTIADNADVTDEASVTAALPVIDSTVLVKGSVTATKLMRIEVDGFAGAVTRVLTMADQNIDLTPGTGSFATEAEGNLAATAVQDGGDLSAASVAIGALVNFKGNSLLLNDGTGSAAPQVADELDLATVAPVGADFLFGWTAAGLMRKFNVSGLPAGSEVNDLVTDGTAGIAINQIPVGTGAGTVAYTATTGTGAPVRTTSPTIVTPVIVSFVTAQHDHEAAAGGGTLGHNAATDNPTVAHGATGAVVGTTNTQTLSAKTLTTPIIVTTGSITDAGGDPYLTFVEAATPIVSFQMSQAAAGGACLLTAIGEVNAAMRITGSGSGAVQVLNPEIGASDWANSTHTHAGASTGGQIATSDLSGTIAHAQIADFVPESILLRESGTGAPSDTIFSEIAIPGTAGAADWVFGWTAAGLLARWDANDFLGGGAEINDLAGDGISGIADNQLAVGTGGGTAAYATLTTSGEALSFDGTTFSQAALADLSDVSGTTGTGSTAVLSTSPTLTTPIIVTGGSITDAGGDPYLSFVEDATPVNRAQIRQGAAAGRVIIGAVGEANAALRVTGAGTGTVEILLPEIGATDWASATHTHAGASTGGQVAIADTTGTLLETRGGTGLAAHTQGDILYSDATNSIDGLSIGTAHQFLRTNSGATAPEWFKPIESRSFTLFAPVDTDILNLWITDVAITITEIRHARLGGTSQAWELFSGVNIDSITTSIESGTSSSNAPVTDSTIGGTAAVSAGNCVNIDLGTNTGGVTHLSMTVFYTKD